MNTRIRWGQLRWVFLGLAGATGIVLGFIGWLEVLDAQSVGDVADAGYRTVSLLGFAGAPPPPLPWTLGLARFILPIVAGWSALVALTIIFRDRFQQLGLPFRRGHVVVVGLGDKGLAFARSSRSKGHRVVAIERNPASSGIKAAREMGAVIISGDGQDPEVLILAGVDRARTVLAVTDDDGVNADVIVQCRGLEARRPDTPSTKLAHVQDAGLAALLRIDQFRRSESLRGPLDYFNIDELGARSIVARYAKADDDTWRTPLMVVGLTPLTQRLLYEAARQWSLSTNEPLPAVVIDREATAGWDALIAAEPQLVAAVEPTLMSKLGELAAVFHERWPSSRPLMVIDLQNDGATIKVAIALRAFATRSHATVVLVTRRSSGLRRVINRLREGELENVHAYALIDECCTYELVNLGLLEVVAQMGHEQYVHERRLQGVDESDPALAPWSQLSAALRESNRDQARHIAAKLRTIDCSIVRSADWQPRVFTFTAQEVERLAVLEHDRWCAERIRGGWRAGPRDHLAKLTPYLVPWEQLPEEVRELDREAVRNIPLQLFKAGAAVERRTDPSVAG